MRIMLALPMFLLCLMASGCATQVAVLQGFEPSANDTSLTVVDARPAQEKTSEHLSRLVTSCDYGIDRLGDEATQPARMRLLQHDLVRLLGDKAKGMTVTVSSYTVHVNNARLLRTMVYGTNQGLIADMMEKMGKECPREKMTGGWYAAAEVNSQYSPVIVEITAQAGGKTHTVRTVFAPAEMVGVSIQAPKTADVIFRAMRKATDTLAAQINN